MCTKNDVLDFIKLQNNVEKNREDLAKKRAAFEKTIELDVELLSLKEDKLETMRTMIEEKLASLKNKTIKAGHYTLKLTEKVSPDVPKAGTPLRKKLEEWLRNNELLNSCSSVSISLVKKLLKSLKNEKQLKELTEIIPNKVDRKIDIEILP